MLTLRLAKAEHLWLKEYVESVAHRDRTAAAVLDKIERSELLGGKRKPSSGIGVPAAVEAIKGVLGSRMVLPPGFPRAGAGWYAPLARKLEATMVSADDVKRAAEVAAAAWRGPIRAESVIRQCDVLLSTAHAEGNTNAQRTTAVEMEEL